MPRKARASSGDDTASSSGEYSSGDAAPGYELPRGATLLGLQRTRLRWLPESHTLFLDVRQGLQNKRQLEAKYKALLNTSTGALEYTGELKRRFRQTKAPSMARLLAAEQGLDSLSMEGEPALHPGRFLPAGLKTLLLREHTLSPGVRLSSGPSGASAGPEAGGSSGGKGLRNLKYFVQLRKEPQVLRRRGQWDSWATWKLDLELDPAAEAARQVAVRGGVRLRAFRFNLTDKQDVQLAVGADYARAGDGAATLTPYAKVGDNSWSFRLQRGVLTAAYEL